MTCLSSGAASLQQNYDVYRLDNPYTAYSVVIIFSFTPCKVISACCYHIRDKQAWNFHSLLYPLATSKFFRATVYPKLLSSYSPPNHGYSTEAYVS